MLESLVKFSELNKKPYTAFIWALIICSIAILLSTQISYQMYVSGITINLTGIFSVVFALIPSVFFVTLLIKKEELIEEKYIKKHYEKAFWERHERDIMIFLFFFAGLTIAFAFWSFVLPKTFFQVQTAKINQIHGLTGAATQNSVFMSIFVNNMQVLLFSFIFSFLFGAGAVFIIIWNASILGVYIGQLSKSIWQIPIVSLAFLPHGIPEIAGYVCAGLAGGLISAAIIRTSNKKILRIVALDAVKILLLGIFLIFIGAGIEVFL